MRLEEYIAKRKREDGINKRFIKGRKQELETTIMYCWLHGVTSDNDYREEYLQNVL